MLPKTSFLIFQLVTIIVSSCISLKCKDEDGKEIAWFIAYKLPRDPNSVQDNLKEGSAYYFMTPSSTQWEKSSRKIHHENSLIVMNVEPLFKIDSSSDIAHVNYNDQPPNIPPMVRNGHTKGLVITDADGGYWFQHSVPHFPNGNGSIANAYPIGGLENGQMFFCLSLEVSEIDNVGNVLSFVKPDIYNFSIPNSMVKLLPQLVQATSKNSTKNLPPWNELLNFECIGNNKDSGLNVTAYVKGPKFRKDVYSDWIAPTLGTGLDVQSWQNGAHPLSSDCDDKSLPVLNINQKEIDGIKFSNKNDHSKWGVGMDGGWVCIGDLNRMKPQKSRGGVTLCLSNQNVWNAFKKSVIQTEPCTGPVPKLYSYEPHAKSYGHPHHHHNFKLAGYRKLKKKHW